MEIRDRTKSPIRRPSPKRRRPHNIPRYMVQIPKICLSLSTLDVFEVKRRYPNLYIPSDFTFHENKWMNVFPMHKPFSIQKPCSFHIMKDVNPVDETIAECVLDPSDADYTWSAKVMLLSSKYSFYRIFETIKDVIVCTLSVFPNIQFFPPP